MDDMTGTTPPPLSCNSESKGPKWAKVLGIFAAVLGALGFLGGLFRPVGAFLQKAQLENLVSIKQADADEVSDFLSEWISSQTIAGVTMAVIALLLLVGGVLLIKRRKISATILRVWALAYLVLGAYFTIKTMPLQEHLMKLLMAPALGSGGGSEADIVEKSMEIGAKMGVGIGLLWILICSLFVLIWFSRRRIRDEVKSWS